VCSFTECRFTKYRFTKCRFTNCSFFKLQLTRVKKLTVSPDSPITTKRADKPCQNYMTHFHKVVF
jgi:hypothetical protein